MALEFVDSGNDDGAIFGREDGKIAFYGHSTAVTRRASSVQATTNLATSSAFGATQLAAVQEIMNTLAGVNLWKGSA